MKKILLFIIALSLVYLVVNRCQTYYRFNPGNNYNYPTSSKVDANYHDAKMVEEYYRLAYEIGSFARIVWNNEGIDVKYPNKADSVSINASKHYKNMQRTVKKIEQKLIQSAELKRNGYSNEDIKFIEKFGISKENIDIHQAIAKRNLQVGDTGRYVWQTQNMLIQQGYDIPLDGKYIDITKDAVKKFQQKYKLYPSGIIDKKTLRVLIGKTQKKK